jgi:hypothetical protein
VSVIDRRISTVDTSIDENVRDAYREAATEIAPPYLDSRIVQLSRTMRHSPALIKSLAWVRPLAFAAMTVLCFAAVLRFGEVGLIGPARDAPAGNVSERASPPGDRTGRLSEAVQATGQKLRELDKSAESLTSNNNPASDLRTAVETPSFCDTVAKATAETWWRCIEELQREGMIDEADLEFELLKSTYASFVPAR